MSAVGPSTHRPPPTSLWEHPQLTVFPYRVLPSHKGRPPSPQEPPLAPFPSAVIALSYRPLEHSVTSA